MSSNTKAAAEKAAEAVDKKAEKAAALVETRRRLAARIAAEAPQNRVELIGDLVTHEGLKLRKASDGRTYARMAGIEAQSMAGEMHAVMNWGNAARRALLADA